MIMTPIPVRAVIVHKDKLDLLFKQPKHYMESDERHKKGDMIELYTRGEKGLVYASCGCIVRRLNKSGADKYKEYVKSIGKENKNMPFHYEVTYGV